MRAKKKVTRERKYVAAVRLTKNGPVMKFSKPNIDEVVEDYTDLAFAVFHELLHILEGHLDIDRIRDRYRVPDLFEGKSSLQDLEGNEGDASLEDRRRWKIIHFVNELEIKHMEHVLLPDEFHDMNRRLYGEDVDREGVGEIPPDKKVLYRGNEDFGNPIYSRLHNRVFSANQYSPLEAFRVLDRVLPDVPDEDEQGGDPGDPGDGEGGGQPPPQDPQGEGEQGSPPGGGSASPDSENEDNEESGSGGKGQSKEDEDSEDESEESGSGSEDSGEESEDEEPGDEEPGDEESGDEEGSGGQPDVSENDPLDHTESGIDEDANAEDVRDLIDALKDMAEDDAGDEADGQDSSGSNDSGGDQSGGSGHSLSPQVSEAKRQPLVDQPENDEVEEEIKKAGTANDFHSKVAADIRDEVGNAIRYSVRPNFRDDHRARIGRKVGRFVPKYKHSRAPSQEKIALYYDISGSQTDYIPACNQIVLHNKKYLANRSVFLFAIGVEEMKISTFSKRAKAGTVQEAVPTYGTDFNDVIRHVKEEGFHKIVVLTDDVSELDDDLIGPMVRSGELEHILVVCTEEKSDITKKHSPGFIHGGPQGGYADEVVRVKPVVR